MTDARQGDGGGLDLRPWAAGVDAGLVVDLLWPLRFQPEQALPWVADILERATMAERRLPVLADWARRWRVIEGDSRGDLPLVHARWVGDVGGGDMGRGPREPTPRGEPPRVRARRSTTPRPARTSASPTSAAAATPMTHSSAGERGQVRAEIEGLPQAGVSGPPGVMGAPGEPGAAGRDGARGRAGAPGPTGAEGRSATVVVSEAPGERATPTPAVRAHEEPRQGGDAALEHRRDAAPATVDGRPEAGARRGHAEEPADRAAVERPVVATPSATRSNDDAVAMPHATGAKVADAAERPLADRSAQVIGAQTAPTTAAPGRGAAPSELAEGAAVVARVQARRVSADEAPALEHSSPVNARVAQRGPNGQVVVAASHPGSAALAAEGDATPRPRAQARAAAVGADTALVEAADRAARGPAGAGAAPLPSTSARPRVQARRADDLPIEATMHADPRRPVRPRERPQASARPRVAGAPIGDVRMPPELDHLAAPSVVAARAQATAASATPRAHDAAAGVTPPVTTQAAAAAPAVDIDALVTTVKKRLAREIRWERELRRAIG